jgi:hypothetical protein
MLSKIAAYHFHKIQELLHHLNSGYERVLYGEVPQP